MFEKLVVPVDLTPASFSAVPIATSMAAQVAGTVDVVTVVDRLADVPSARDALAAAIEALGPQPAQIDQVVLADRSVATALTRHIETNPGSMLLLRSHGHGRSAAVVGGTVDEMLRAMFGPIIVVGPLAESSRAALDGTYVVPVDGSARAKGVIPIVAAWSIEFSGTPCLVEVMDDRHGISIDIESSYVRSQAIQLERRIGRHIDFEVLHGTKAAHPIVDFAAAQGASLIFIATHGRSGFERLRMGSVAADIIRHATMPVVLFRPPHFIRRNGSPAPGRVAASI
ncbi:MAG: universal stress protein [Ilumatobacteraceae bacterium]